jgi:ABC-type multidrug transport system fused ATPase/permease subunit
VILRRLYLYLVSAAALATLAAGLSALGFTVLMFVFNDPNADASRGALAGATAATLVALVVWGVHFWFARRYAHRDPAERASAIRRLYVYWACLVMSIGAAIALDNAIANYLRPIFDCSTVSTTSVYRPFDCHEGASLLPTAQAAWIALVLGALWALHYRIATRDRAAVGEQGRSASLRRWYMYPALLVGLLMMLSGAASLIILVWLRLVNSSLGTDQNRYIGDAAGLLVGGAVLWGFHARVLAQSYLEDDRKSTLRALEGFIAVAVCILFALIGAAQILYYALARLLGVASPGNVGSDVVAAMAAPVCVAVVYGAAWFLVRRRLSRDTGSHEVDRQAGVRRLYTNLAALVSMATLGTGAAGVIWYLAEQIEAPLIGVSASDWKDPISLWATLFVVGLAVWLAHWRHAPWPGDRQSLSRRLYVWAALLISVLAVLGSGIALLNVVLQQVFSANPRLNSVANLDFGHYLAVLVVAVVIGVYHWRVLRADAASRPAKHEVEVVAAVIAPAAVVTVDSVITSETVPTSHGKRYVLSVVDASEDDVHQALANLPPAASYHLIPEPEV